MNQHRIGWGKTINFTVVLIVLVSLLSSSFTPVIAQDNLSNNRSSGNSFVVVSTSDDVNGNTSSPAALLADPGPDGISLPEAIDATNHTSDFYTITFDPSLSGSTIYLQRDMPHITQGNVIINGDINEDGTPDITIDGTDADFVCFNINGSSNVVIRGFKMFNFDKHGVYIFPNSGDGRPDVENIIIYQNEIVADAGQISLMISEQDNCSIRNVEINSNYLHDGPSSISILAGMGTATFNNEISNVAILNNTINNPGQTIDIMASPAASSGSYGNTVSNIEIRGNTITGWNDSSILVDASNQGSSGNNTFDGLLITDNYIEGIAVGIELVGESGGNSTGNLMTNVTITDNTLIGCGIHVAGSTGYNSHGNTTSNLTFERNYLDATGISGSANGIYLAAGADGAYGNSLENLLIRDNFIQGFRDAGILLHANDFYSPNNSINNVTILNQTITGNAIGNSWASAININTKDPSNTITNVTIMNSILYGNGGGDAIKGSVTPEIVAYNILNDVRFTGSDGNFYSNPQFVNTSSGDYRLQPTSPAVDTGDPTATGVSAEDLDLNARVVDGNSDIIPIVDLGAWEYSATAVQEIAIEGNGESIFNNDVTPSTWDATDFGPVELGSSPVQATFTIENTGGSPLSLIGASPVQISGANAGDFTVIAQPDITINGGQSTTFTIEFSPSDAGLRSATLEILSNDADEGEYTFAIQGVGEEPLTPPEISVEGYGTEIQNGDTTPSTADDTDFGSTRIGDDAIQKPFTIKNTGETTLLLTGTNPVEITGDAAGDFSVISQPSASISGGQSSTFTIAFTPSVSGLREATVEIANNDSDEGTYTFAIQGYAQEPQEIAVSGNGVDIVNGDNTPSTEDGTDYGSAVVGGSSVQVTYAIENTGEIQLQLNGDNPVEIGGFHAGDFTVITPPERNIDGGGSTTFTIEFTPSEAGSRFANIIIPNTDADEGMFSFDIQGNGEEPPTAQEISVQGNDQEINNGDSSPTTLDDTDFGGAEVNSGAVQKTFTVRNIGESTLLLTGSSPVAIIGDHAGDFAVISQPSASIAGGSSSTFTVEFTPSETGRRTASIQILNNDSDESAFTFVIQGDGLEPPEIAIFGKGTDISDGDNTPSSLDGTDFGDAELGGASVQVTFTIANIGDLPLELTGSSPVEITGTNAGDFIVTAQPNETINGGETTTFTITFTPSGLGYHEATVHIANNDADEGGFNFRIQGNGVEELIEDFYNFVPLFLVNTD